jgi:hypothetical protein
MLRPMRARLALAIFCVGCTDLGSYATEPGEVYRGSVVGVEDPPVLRRGFAAETVLEMSFDPRNATSLTEPPGALTTSDGSLSAVALEPIVPLSHDVLGEYEIPSGDRVRNYIFLARPTEGPLAGREPMVFVSLMGDGSLEVRIVAGGGSRTGDYFGLFRMRRMQAE